MASFAFCFPERVILVPGRSIGMCHIPICGLRSAGCRSVRTRGGEYGTKAINSGGFLRKPRLWSNPNLYKPRDNGRRTEERNRLSENCSLPFGWQWLWPLSNDFCWGDNLGSIRRFCHREVTNSGLLPVACPFRKYGPIARFHTIDPNSGKRRNRITRERGF